MKTTPIKKGDIMEIYVGYTLPLESIIYSSFILPKSI